MIVTTINRVWPEALAAAEWYQDQCEGLGSEFMDAFEAALDRIKESRFRYPVVFRDVRRVQMEQFPYGVYFVANDDEVQIFAVVHLRRDPRHWRRYIPVTRPSRH